jgi:D-alanyl-D-alanine carboxypeptidase
MKTGFTSASGFNLVSSARRHGCRLVGVVLGGASIRSRDRQMMHLLDLAFANTLKRTPGLQVTDADITATPSTDPEAETGGVLKASVSEDSDAEAPAVRWGVVVGGAFRHKSSARATLGRASRRAPHELRSARSEVTRISRHHRVRYDARFVGLDKAGAVRACARLKRKSFRCRVVRQPADADAEAASSS